MRHKYVIMNDHFNKKANMKRAIQFLTLLKFLCRFNDLIDVHFNDELTTKGY